MYILKRSLSRIAVASFSAAVLGLAACTNVSQITKESVSRTETAIQQAQTTIGTSEDGAVDLQRARDELALAQRAMNDSKDEDAQRLALRAQLDAELAVAKSQSATARKAAQEMLASIQTLRNEASRETPPSR